jgi:hypothetical protein
MGRLAGLAEGVAAAARRRQRDRAPRVTLYDLNGEPRLLAPETAAFDDIVSAAERILALAAGEGDAVAGGADPARPPSSAGVSFPPTNLEPDREAGARGGKRDEG